MTFLRPYRQRSVRYKFVQGTRPALFRGHARKRKEGASCSYVQLRKKNQLKKISEEKGNSKAAASLQQTSGRRFSSIHRIGKHWLSKPPVIYRGEREICNPATEEGQAEYKYRTMLLWIRQDGWCCFREYDFCPGRLKLSEATFEHEGKRTRGQRDDRIAIFKEGRFVRHLNGAAHLNCNLIAGSRKLPIWHGRTV